MIRATNLKSKIQKTSFFNEIFVKIRISGKLKDCNRSEKWQI